MFIQRGSVHSRIDDLLGDTILPYQSTTKQIGESVMKLTTRAISTLHI